MMASDLADGRVGPVRVPGIPSANEVYSGMRLLYSDTFEQTFLFRSTFFQLMELFIPCLAAGSLFLFAIAPTYHLLVKPQSQWTSDEQALLITASIMSGLVVFVLWGFRRRRYGLASWQVMLEDRHDVADVAGTVVLNELNARLPSDLRRSYEPKRRGASHRLIRISQGTIRSYVSIFPYGSGLYVGWSMVDEPHFWNVVGGWLRNLVRGGGWFGRELRSQEAKALRDLVHHVTRRAVAAAAAATAAAVMQAPKPPAGSERAGQAINEPPVDFGPA